MKFVTSTLFFCVAALLALGVVMLCSASTGQAEARHLIMQPIWCAVGLVVCGAVACVDYRWLKRYPALIWLLYGLVVVLLVLAIVPGTGLRVKGASRWLRLGGFTMQPSELAKIALILILAFYGDRYQRHMQKFLRGMVLPGLIVAIVVGLVFVEPDVGTALLLCAISSIMLLVAGIRWRYFLPPVVVLGVLLGTFLYHNPMRSDRIYSWLHLEETKLGKGMQAYQAMVALGSGGVTGKGLGDGTQKLGFVPEHHTDFIFSVVGEELGLVATLLVIFAFAMVVFCGIYISWHAPDTFGMLTAAGITFLIGLQVVINVGVVTGSLPNKGLSLPFISYGGSNLVIMLTGVGILLSIARRADAPGTLSMAGIDEAPARA